MSTWCGAVIELRGRELSSLPSRHRVTASGPPARGPGDTGEWAHVVGDVNLAHIEPPRFAREVSAELGGTVIAFMIQTNASCELLEHWEGGALVRRLECSDGRWKAVMGHPQAWEAAYFFDPGEGTGEGEKWPLSLDDDISEDDRIRYEEARSDGDPSRVLDLLRGGNVRSMRRLLEHHGLDPNRPAGRYAVPANWKPWALTAVIAAFVLGCAALGALSR